MTADLPTTPAIDAARSLDLDFDVVRFERAFSVEEGAAKQNIPLAALIKTLVVRRGDDDYVFVLIPGDRAMDWAKLRAAAGVRRVALPDAAEAQNVTGYERGEITPFGASHTWPVMADRAIGRLELASIGGGAHGVALHARGAELLAVLGAEVADLSKPAASDSA